MSHVLMSWTNNVGSRASGGRLADPPWEAILGRLRAIDDEGRGSVSLNRTVGVLGDSVEVQVIFDRGVFFVMQVYEDEDGEPSVATFRPDPSWTWVGGEVVILGDLYPVAETSADIHQVIECFRRFYEGLPIDPDILD